MEQQVSQLDLEEEEKQPEPDLQNFYQEEEEKQDQQYSQRASEIDKEY